MKKRIGPGGPGGPGGGGGGPATQAEKDALKQVKLKSFGVTPMKVSPFGSAIVTWDTTVPNTGFDIVIALNGQAVANTGSMRVTLEDQTKTFSLAAVIDDPRASRILRSIPLIVNLTDCQTATAPASVVTVPLKEAMDGAFSGGGSFSLKDGGSVVTAGPDGLVDIRVPIAIDVPDWFDADMDIHIQLTIRGAGGRVFVTAPLVDPQVSWSLLSNIASFGCTDKIGNGMTKISHVFLERIVDNEIRPVVQQSMEGAVNTFLTTFHNNDPQQRTFVMTTLFFSVSRGLEITGCPQAA